MEAPHKVRNRRIAAAALSLTARYLAEPELDAATRNRLRAVHGALAVYVAGPVQEVAFLALRLTDHNSYKSRYKWRGRPTAINVLVAYLEALTALGQTDQRNERRWAYRLARLRAGGPQPAGGGDWLAGAKGLWRLPYRKPLSR